MGRVGTKSVAHLPLARGPLSEMLLVELSRGPHALPPSPAEAVGPDVLGDEDLQLSLYLCYELHYRGLHGVDERWEWDPSLLALRAELEATFEDALRYAVAKPENILEPGEMDLALREIEKAEGPSLSSYIRSRATLDQVREFMIHRSAYQLKEADPHSWAVPRLAGAAKAALIEIQLDEYGRGRADWMHAELFARAMRAVRLDSAYGAYLDQIPGVTLATVNLMSMFGLHRRWRGAIVGHLALFEMTSSIPNRRYAEGLRRLGFDGEATLFFEEHVTADAVHENIACVDLAGGLARQEPALSGDILWGARTLAYLDARWSEQLLGAWERRESSLLRLSLDAAAA
jgi:heme oxygenase-like protein